MKEDVPDVLGVSLELQSFGTAEVNGGVDVLLVADEVALLHSGGGLDSLVLGVLCHNNNLILLSKECSEKSVLVSSSVMTSL